jgi:hypothetical protein
MVPPEQHCIHWGVLADLGKLKQKPIEKDARIGTQMLIVTNLAIVASPKSQVSNHPRCPSKLICKYGLQNKTEMRENFHSYFD